MADTPVSEEDIFDSAVPEAPAASEVPQETAQESAERLRDEQGRFAAKAEEAPPAQEQPQAAEQGTPQTQHGVPTAAIQDERRRRQEAEGKATAYERQIAELNARFDRFLQQGQQPQQPQEAPQPPDFFENPGAFVQHQLQSQLQPFEQVMQSRLEGMSRSWAAKEYGQDKVDAAYNELKRLVQTDPVGAQGDWARIMKSGHPYGTLVEWHQQRQAMSEVGSDPRSWAKDKWAKEFAATPEGAQYFASLIGPASQQPAANGRSAPLVNLTGTPSINRAPGSANTPASHAPASEEDIFNSA